MGIIWGVSWKHNNAAKHSGGMRDYSKSHIRFNFILVEDTEWFLWFWLEVSVFQLDYNNIFLCRAYIPPNSLSRYQVGLETQMRGSDSIFDCVNILYQKFHKISFKRGSSYIDSPNWVKKKKAEINTKNNDHKCFQYVATIKLNH